MRSESDLQHLPAEARKRLEFVFSMLDEGKETNPDSSHSRVSLACVVVREYELVNREGCWVGHSPSDDHVLRTSSVLLHLDLL